MGVGVPCALFEHEVVMWPDVSSCKDAAFNASVSLFTMLSCPV